MYIFLTAGETLDWLIHFEIGVKAFLERAHPAFLTTYYLVVLVIFVWLKNSVCWLIERCITNGVVVFHCTINNFTFVSLKLTRCEWNWFDTTRLNPGVSELNVFSLVIVKYSTIMWFHWSKPTNSNKAFTYPPASLLSCLKFSRCRHWYEVLKFDRICTYITGGDRFVQNF